VSSVFDVYESYLEAKALGAPATQPRVYDGHWQTFIFDPDGYKLKVFTADGGDPPPLVAEENDGLSTAAKMAQSAGRSPKSGRLAGTNDARRTDP
ncbi:MAG: VOC family protein, partial [Planctomycetota bacterium]